MVGRKRASQLERMITDRGATTVFLGETYPFAMAIRREELFVHNSYAL